MESSKIARRDVLAGAAAISVAGVAGSADAAPHANPSPPLEIKIEASPVAAVVCELHGYMIELANGLQFRGRTLAETYADVQAYNTIAMQRDGPAVFHRSALGAWRA